MVGRDDRLAVEFHEREFDGGGAGGDDDVFGGELSRLAGARRYTDSVGGDEGGGAGDDGDLAGFCELGDAADELGDDGVFLFEERGEVEFDGTEFHPVFSGVLFCEDVVLRGSEEGFAGNATDVETRAAEGGAFFDEGDFEAELRGAEGADVAAGAGTDYDEVEGRGSRHVRIFLSSRHRARSLRQGEGRSKKRTMTRTRNEHD